MQDLTNAYQVHVKSFSKALLSKESEMLEVPLEQQS